MNEFLLKSKANIIYLLIVFFLTVFCSNKEDLSMLDNYKISQEDIDTVSKARIYFGHQSVGQNIIDGIKSLNNVHLNIIDEITKSTPKYYFFHQRIGKNTKPKLKCDDFLSQLDSTEISKLDIAFMKFCYIDFSSNVDIDALFSYYSETIDRVKQQYPHLILIHCTTPLETQPGALKSFVKMILGKGDVTKKANIARFTFNSKMKEFYKNEPIFDIAKIESSYEDGSRESFNVDGVEYYSLRNDLTDDGGHLNQVGSRLLAIKLIETLAYVLSNKN